MYLLLRKCASRCCRCSLLKTGRRLRKESLPSRRVVLSREELEHSAGHPQAQAAKCDDAVAFDDANRASFPSRPADTALMKVKDEKW